jgi:hypothetical protein
MVVSLDDAMTTDTRTSVVSPRSVILHLGDYRCEALLTAATEGATRFVASAPDEPGPSGDGVATALQMLADQCGDALTQEDIEAIIVRGRPLSARVVGELIDADRAALHAVERDGTVRILTAHDAPPRRASRRKEWAEQIAAQSRRGANDLLIVALPTGNVPVWAAQLVNAVQESPRRADHQLVILASDAALAPALLPDTILLERNDTLPRTLAGTLAHIRAARRAPNLPARAHALSAVAATAAGVSFARGTQDETIAYLNLSEGSTIVIAHPAGIDVLHDADCDMAAGAVTLLHRVGAETIARWIPFPMDAASLRSWAVRRVAAPRALLIDPADRAIAGGFARAVFRVLIARSAAPHTPTRCIVGPGLMRIGMAADAMRAVADSVPVSRLAAIEADVDDLLPAVGYFAMHAADSARSLLAHDALAPLGTILAVPSRGERSDAAVVALLTGSSGETRTPIARDELTPIALRSAGTIRLIRRDGREESCAVGGGPGGVLVDTRARPLRGSAAKADTRGKISDRLRAPVAGEERA